MNKLLVASTVLLASLNLLANDPVMDIHLKYQEARAIKLEETQKRQEKFRLLHAQAVEELSRTRPSSCLESYKLQLNVANLALEAANYHEIVTTSDKAYKDGAYGAGVLAAIWAINVGAGPLGAALAGYFGGFPLGAFVGMPFYYAYRYMTLEDGIEEIAKSAELLDESVSYADKVYSGDAKIIDGMIMPIWRDINNNISRQQLINEFKKIDEDFAFCTDGKISSPQEIRKIVYKRIKQENQI